MNQIAAVLDFFDRGPGLLPPGGNESAHRLEVRPMRMAVNVQGVGRYAVQYDQERTDEIFTRVFSTLLEALDVLVDGPFVLARKSYDALFRGSDNQRLLDVPASLRAGRAVLWTRPDPLAHFVRPES